MPKITSRELQIIQMYADGKKGKVISSELGITYKTVDIHLYNARKKVSCVHLSHLISYCFRKGLIK